MSTAVHAPAASHAPAKVWLFQSSLQHYRLPVWDGLVEAGRGTYTFEVFGPTIGGEAVGGGRRDYFREMPTEKVRRFGLSYERWPTAAEAIRHQRPDVVIMVFSMRIADCWTLPSVCRRTGAAVIGWSKFYGRAAGPGWMQRAIKRRFLRGIDYAICYGQSSLDALVSLGYPSQRACVAQNTIDTERIFREGAAIRERGRLLREAAGMAGRKIVLCVGRMEAKKRHRDLLAAWPSLRSLDEDLRLVMVGSGPLLEPLRAEAAALDRERILFTGRVPEGDDYAWLAAADVVLLPGAVGLALNQALALGTPTVIADEPGSDAEPLVHGQTGWRYPKGNSDAMLAAVAEVLRDPTAAGRVGARASEWIRDRVNIQNMVRAIDGTIRQAIELSRQRKQAT